MLEHFQTFKSPEYFYLILLSIFIAYAVRFYFFRKKTETGLKDSFGLTHFLNEERAGLFGNILRLFKNIMFFSGFVFLLIALARPQSKYDEITEKSEGIHIIMVLDISDSMLIEDMKPVNRLESAKKRIREFVYKRVNDYIGLVVFSGQSYTRVPLTLDYELLLESVSLVKTSERLEKGTAIGMALANAIKRLEKVEGDSKVIILLTDGENNVGAIDPNTALEIAVQKGIRIYTVGMGKDGMARLPILRKLPNGAVQKFYRPMHSKVNEKLLKLMADSTGGKYFRAIHSGTLDQAFSSIDQLEKIEVEVKKHSRVKEHYQFWALWGLLLILGSQFFYLGVLWRNL